MPNVRHLTLVKVKGGVGTNCERSAADDVLAFHPFNILVSVDEDRKVRGVPSLCLSSTFGQKIGQTISRS